MSPNPLETLAKIRTNVAAEVVQLQSQLRISVLESHGWRVGDANGTALAHSEDHTAYVFAWRADTTDRSRSTPDPRPFSRGGADHRRGGEFTARGGCRERERQRPCGASCASSRTPCA